MRRAFLLPALVFAIVPLPGFHSPSGNIRCYDNPSGRGPVLHCQIAQSTYAASLQKRCLRPDGSGVDWHGFELGATTRGLVTCSGGILYDAGRSRPTYANLPYGLTWRRSPFTCASRITGVTCRNAHGHGLFISRAAWRVW
jgi:uncharacterized protein DUF6636